MLLKLTKKDDNSYVVWFGECKYYAQNIKEVVALIKFIANHTELFLPQN